MRRNDTALLLSGGIDSVALAFMLRPQFAITINYGQQAAFAEIRASKKICEEVGIQHDVVSIDCRAIGMGEMAGEEQHPCAPSDDWWPFRNQLLITIAAGRALKLGARIVVAGTVKTDSEYVDGQKKFYDMVDRLVSMQEGGIHISAPAIGMTTPELVRKSGIDFNLLSWAHSCTRGDYACGMCRSCMKHRAVMKELGYPEY